MNKENKNNDSFSLLSIGIIIIITLILLVPLVAEVRDKIPFFSLKSDTNPKTSAVGEELPKKTYKTNVKYIGFSFPGKGEAELLAVKARNNGEIIFIYNEETEYYGSSVRIMKKSISSSEDGEEIIPLVSSYYFPETFCDSIKEGNYTYIDFEDDYIFISNNKSGYLINAVTMKVEKLYRLPKEYNIYQSALSGGRDKIAFTAESGLYISDCDFENIKELVSTVYTLNNTVITSQFPVWAKDDEYIFYRLYVNGKMNGIGKTSASPGNNRQHTGIGNLRFEFQSGDKIFYHQSSNSATDFENQFICGYFDLETKEMKVKIKSSVYYYDIMTGNDGNFIAALSNNGLLKKLNIIDIYSKKIIYYDLFDYITEFCFSPDETKLIIRAVKEGEDILTLVDIYESDSNQAS